MSILHFTFPIKIVLYTLLWGSFLSADPWGKDADLCLKKKDAANLEIQSKSILDNISYSLISFHQNVISPADGPRSHFYPSSSQYTLEAIRTYGFFTGFIMGCDRLMRENSEEWVYQKKQTNSGTLKFDPIP